MRTTITLDADVAAKLKAASRKSGRSFKEVLNSLLRLALNTTPRGPQAPFVVKGRPLGLKPGLRYDNIGELLEQAEGPEHP